MTSQFNNETIKGRWHDINNKVEKKINAKYHKIKDWVMDSKSYFLIAIDRKKDIKSWILYIYKIRKRTNK